MARSKVALGMGMDALYLENDTGNLQSQKLRLTEISPNKSQPRRDFDDAALEALADSIRQHGVLQPILVRPMPGGGYQIVAGERRWRASRLAGLDEIPVYIRELDDKQAYQLALVENLQREDLNPVEEAAGYRELMDSTGATQEEISKVVGRSRSAVANSLRLLSLEPKILEMLKKGDITAGHARAVLSLGEQSEREELAQLIKREGMTVRQAEDAAKRIAEEAKKRSDAEAKKPPKRRESIFHEVELSLKETAGRVCSVKENKKGGGVITVEFYDKDDLMAIARQLENIKFRKDEKND